MNFAQTVYNFVHRRRNAYKITFNNPTGEFVLDDLAVFCRANESCFHPDDRVNALMEGRREVWLRIKNHLDLTDEQLTKLYSRKVNNE